MDRLSALFKILGDRNRLRIINMLTERRLCVCELAFVLGIAQPSVSRHLKKIRAAGLIDGERNGLWTDYYLCPRDREARKLLEQVKEGLRDDPQAAEDRRRLQDVNRALLCSPDGGHHFS